MDQLAIHRQEVTEFNAAWLVLYADELEVKKQEL